MARLLAAAALVLSGTFGCASSSPTQPEVAEVIGGRCRCEGGAFCVQSVGADGSKIGMQCVLAQSGCTSLSAPGRTCWGSSSAVGLCLCSGSMQGLVASSSR